MVGHLLSVYYCVPYCMSAEMFERLGVSYVIEEVYSPWYLNNIDKV